MFYPLPPPFPLFTLQLKEKIRGLLSESKDKTKVKGIHQVQGYYFPCLPFKSIYLKDEGVRRWDKSYGMNLSTNSVGDILKIFLNQSTNPRKSQEIANCFLNLLVRVVDFFERQDLYHVFASSLLFVYDLNAFDKDDTQLENLVRLKMIDFAHVFPSNGQKDENFLFGAQNLHKLFKEFLNG